MKKVIVIGCPGSGKTTFSCKLSDATLLPIFHLDAIWHKSDRSHISREDFDSRLLEILGREEWIIDGNYGRSLEVRLSACDTVFLFDLPIEECIEGVRSRIGTKRKDIPWIEKEFDPEFKHQIEEFPFAELPGIYELLRRYGEGIEVVVFKSRAAADEYVDGILRSELK